MKKGQTKKSAGEAEKPPYEPTPFETEALAAYRAAEETRGPRLELDDSRAASYYNALCQGRGGQGIMVGDIGGELMRQGGRMDRVKEQIVLIARTQNPGRGAGEIAGPARVGYIREGHAVLGGEVGRIAGHQIEVSIGGQVVDLEAQVLERDEVGEHRLIKRLRKAAGEILPGRSAEWAVWIIDQAKPARSSATA